MYNNIKVRCGNNVCCANKTVAMSTGLHYLTGLKICSCQVLVKNGAMLRIPYEITVSMKKSLIICATILKKQQKPKGSVQSFR